MNSGFFHFRNDVLTYYYAMEYKNKLLSPLFWYSHIIIFGKIGVFAFTLLFIFINTDHSWIMQYAITPLSFYAIFSSPGVNNHEVFTFASFSLCLLLSTPNTSTRGINKVSIQSITSGSDPLLSWDIVLLMAPNYMIDTFIDGWSG